MSKLYRHFAHSFGDLGAHVSVAEYETTVLEGRTFVLRPIYGLHEVTDEERQHYHETRGAALIAASDQLKGVALALFYQAEGLRKEAAGV